MLQRLAKVLKQLKTGIPSENLLNEIRQIIYLCIKKKKFLKKYATI